VFDACRHEQRFARLKCLPFAIQEKNTAAALDDINFVPIVSSLIVDPVRLVKAELHAAMVEQDSVLPVAGFRNRSQCALNRVTI
jgi:hypothetical protein